MIQCKRFRWEDEFNEWAKTANINGDQVVVILHAKDDSMMIFYDKSYNKQSNPRIWDTQKDLSDNWWLKNPYVITTTSNQTTTH